MAAAREHVLGRILPRVSSACDLACGVGTTAVELATTGIEVVAVDLSKAMCRITREKARHAGLAIRVLCADMRAFRLPRPVDLVTCEYDALNHVPRKRDLRKGARGIASAEARRLLFLRRQQPCRFPAVLEWYLPLRATGSDRCHAQPALSRRPGFV
jgi:ubiquinone/menaquinone biosynthesis C-methylase UbiE